MIELYKENDVEKLFRCEHFVSKYAKKYFMLSENVPFHVIPWKCIISLKIIFSGLQ